jgi:uncharacterized membrane protein
MPPLLLLGAALGGAAMFFLDPEKGRRRRALVRDQAVKATSNVKHLVASGKRDLAHRGSVATGRVRSFFKRRPASDPVLVERVRSKMGHYVAHPGAIDVSAFAGHVTLSGSIFAHERDELIEAIGSVPGVSEVFDELAVYETAEGISELQGGRERRAIRPGGAQESWAPGTRLVTGAAGTTLTMYALMRRSRFAGFVALATGVALLARTATNKPLARLAGMRGYKGIDIQKTIHIDAPVDDVFVFLADYDNYPRFMRNVLSVETFADGRSHWKVAGPAGVPVEWDSITTRVERNELIEWSTIAGSPVEHAGSIDLERAGEGTRVRIEMSYNPPAGALGHVVAKLFGADPKSELDEDMMRLKSTLETGKLPRDAAAARLGTPKEPSL